MMCTEEYEERIEYSRSMLFVRLSHGMRQSTQPEQEADDKREISLEYLTDESTTLLGTADKYFEIPE